MTLTANGRLLLGTTTEGTYLLDVNGSGRFSETSWITKNQNGVTSINLVNNDLNNDAGQALRFYFNTSTPLGGIIHQYNTGTSAYDLDFKVWSGFSPVTRLFLNGSTGAATFSSSVTATQFTSQGGRGTSYGYKLPDWQIYNTTSGNRLAFSDYTTDFLTITSGGNLLVGTNTDSGEKLVVSGSAKVTSTLFAESNITFSGFIKPSSNVGYGVKSTDGAVLQEWYNGLNKFYSKVNYTPMATPSSPSAGDVYYDSTSNKLRCYNGTSWNDLF
jgi:hypothetical protein